VVPIPVAVQSKAGVCVRSQTGIASSNPVGTMDVCLLGVLCVVKQRSLRRTDLLSREVPPPASTRVSLSVPCPTVKFSD